MKISLTILLENVKWKIDKDVPLDVTIYCHEEHGERVSIQRVRELRNNIRNEAAWDAAAGLGPPDIIDLEFGAYATS